MSATEAKQNFAELLDRSRTAPVVIKRHDRDIAVLISPEDYEDLRKLRVKELLEITERTGAYAEDRGMTDELLQHLLADES